MKENLRDLSPFVTIMGSSAIIVQEEAKKALNVGRQVTLTQSPSKYFRGMSKVKGRFRKACIYKDI